MATSGSSNFNLARDQIITIAFQHINVYNEGDTIAAADMTFASNLLNMMMKSWQTGQPRLWTKTEAKLFLQLGQTEYELSSTGDNATSNYVNTTLSADEASGQTIISLTSSTGMTVADNIGIILDDGTVQWTTISSIPDSTSVVIAAALTDDATSGNIVYSYTTKIDRPLQVFSCRRNSSADQDTPMFMYSYDEYFNLPNKTSTGTPTSATYNPQLNNGILYIWPSPISTTDTINITFARPIQDMDIATNNPDFPQEWLEVLAMQLAVKLSYRYGKRREVAELKNDADILLDQLSNWDNELASIYFQPAQY